EHHGLGEPFGRGGHPHVDVRVTAQTRSYRDHGFSFGQRLQPRVESDGAHGGFGERLGHQFGRVGRDFGDGARRRGHRDKSRAGAQRAQAGHGGGARFAARAGYHQHT